MEAVAKLEHEELHRRSSGEKVSDFFVSLMGCMLFLVFHVAWFAAWFTINLNAVPGVAPFDPFPFGVLTLIVSSEGVFLAIFILISQSRMHPTTIGVAFIRGACRSSCCVRRVVPLR